jgi:uncharacterized protein DUF397
LSETWGGTKTWRRSTHCSDGACVEIADDGDRVLMRDSKDISQPALDLDRAVWGRFVADIKNGSFGSA